MPHLGDHVDSPVVELNRCRIDTAISDVDLSPNRGYFTLLGLARYIHIRRRVEQRVEVTKMNIFNHGRDVLCRHPFLRDLIEFV